MRIRSLISCIKKTIASSKRVQPSLDVTRAVGSFTACATQSFLVSFPRTGSHWLRMLMELYFECPQLKLTYYYTDRDDYQTYHTHDKELDIAYPNVIYLYREPVATIYSQLYYEKQDVNDREWICYWTELYALHLTKWLYAETFTQRKTVIKYERLQKDPHREFAKITAHFGTEFDAERFDHCTERASKKEIARKTAFDQQRINLSKAYALGRRRFQADHTEFIWSVLLRSREFLKPFFDV